MELGLEVLLGLFEVGDKFLIPLNLIIVRIRIDSRLLRIEFELL